MAKILRKAAKIFGLNAGVNQIAQFGSLAAGSIAYSTDPDQIQSLANYLVGWFDAVVGGNSPAIEDMNALFYLLAYQVAYLLQQGIAEYNATTTYYINSIVTSGGVNYISIVDSNVGNAVTDGTKWAAQVQNGLYVPLALPFTLGTTVPTGDSLFWQYLTMSGSQVLTVSDGARLTVVDSITLSGSSILALQGDAIVRII